MPLIADLVSPQRLAAIRKHTRSPDYKEKVKQALLDIRSFANHPGVNKEVLPTVWTSYGKDSTALWLLCKEAEINYQVAFINCRLELPQHYLIVEEFNKWIGFENDVTTYSTEGKGIDCFKEAIAISKVNRNQRKDLKPKPPISFFDPQEAYELFYYWVGGQFHWEHIGDRANTLNFWATRGSEGMGRQWELSKQGKMFQPPFTLKKGNIPTWRSLPVGNWQDLDVWAYLMEWNCPVSPVYGMNDLPQRGVGRNAYPRTLWYCDSHVFNTTFAKWLKHYAPAQLHEIIETFPEVRARLI